MAAIGVPDTFRRRGIACIDSSPPEEEPLNYKPQSTIQSTLSNLMFKLQAPSKELTIRFKVVVIRCLGIDVNRTWVASQPPKLFLFSPQWWVGSEVGSALIYLFPLLADQLLASERTHQWIKTLSGSGYNPMLAIVGGGIIPLLSLSEFSY